MASLLAAYEVSPLTHWKVLVVPCLRPKLSLYARREPLSQTIALVHIALEGISIVTNIAANKLMPNTASTPRRRSPVNVRNGRPPDLAPSVARA